MDIRAEHDHEFNMRKLWIVAFFAGWSIWSAYDLAYTYPASIKKIEIYDKIKSESSDLDEAKKKWAKMAEEKGWARKPPKSTVDGVQWSIMFNYITLVGGAILAIFFTWKYFKIRSSWFGADEERVKNSFGLDVPFKSIQSVDKKKWAKKGIAHVTYKDEQGNSNVFVMDDFKYVREPMGEIMRRIEQHLKPEQIIGGEPEKDKQETDNDTGDDHENEEQISDVKDENA